MNRVRSIIALELNPGLGIVGTPPTMTLGAAYSFVFIGTNGQPLYRWSGSGALPGGVTFNTTTATLSAATVTSAGIFPFTVTLVDGNRMPVSRTYDLRAVALPLTISGSLGNHIVGAVVSGVIYTSGGGYGAKTYALASGSLPAGLVLHADGTVTGTATTAGFIGWRVQVTDSLGTIAELSDSSSTSYAPITATGSLPAGMVGVPYSSAIAISGGDGTYSAAITAGALPASATGAISGSSYVVSGTPTTAATSVFTVHITDGSVSTPADSAQSLVVAVPLVYGTWDVAKTNGSFTLTSGDLTATLSATGSHTYKTIAGTVAINAAVGKSMFTVQVATAQTNLFPIGICATDGGQSAWDSGSNWPGGANSGDSLAWFGLFNKLYFNWHSDSADTGTGTPTSPAYAAGDLLLLAFDPVALTVMIFNMSQAQALICSYTIPSAVNVHDWFPCVSPAFAGEGATLNCGQTTITPPSALAGLGYSPRWAA